MARTDPDRHCPCGIPQGAEGGHEPACPFYDHAAPARPDVKDTNPKDAIGSRKVPTSTLPARVVAEAGLAMLEGACKYGRHNYRIAGVRASVYFDAVGRHLAAWWEGQDLDPDSGLSHITKAIAGLAVLRDSMMQGNWEDDRPPRVSNVDSWVAEMNAQAAKILARWPNPKPPFTQVALNAAPLASLDERR